MKSFIMTMRCCFAYNATCILYDNELEHWHFALFTNAENILEFRNCTIYYFKQ